MAKPNIRVIKFSNEVNSNIPITGILMIQFDTLVDVVSGNITFQVIDSSGNPDIVYKVDTSATIVDYKLNPTDTVKNASYIAISYTGIINDCQYCVKLDYGIVKSRDDEIPNDEFWKTTDAYGVETYSLTVTGNSSLASNVPSSIVFDVSTSPFVTANSNVITLDLSTINLSPYTRYRLKFDDGAILSTTGEVLLYDNFPEYTFVTGA